MVVERCVLEVLRLAKGCCRADKLGQVNPLLRVDSISRDVVPIAVIRVHVIEPVVEFGLLCGGKERCAGGWVGSVLEQGEIVTDGICRCQLQQEACGSE